MQNVKYYGRTAAFCMYYLMKEYLLLVWSEEEFRCVLLLHGMGQPKGSDL